MGISRDRTENWKENHLEGNGDPSTVGQDGIQCSRNTEQIDETTRVRCRLGNGAEIGSHKTTYNGRTKCRVRPVIHRPSKNLAAVVHHGSFVMQGVTRVGRRKLSNAPV